MIGLISDIQRGSIHDGPGIRTVAFVKGCNLRCFWCHNPEALLPRRQLSFNPGRCLHCGACERVCPSPSKCQSCFHCVDACLAGARTISGCERSATDVVAEILLDRPFYATSGGGVTISGGEPTMQADFVATILGECRRHGIHTALESNLCCPTATLDRLLPLADLIMADIKCMDPQRHREATGTDNATILANLRHLGRLGAAAPPLIIRTPIVTGFNDCVAELSAIAAFLRELPPLRYYELLSYHPLGCQKARELGMQDFAQPLPAIPPSRILELANAVANQLPCPLYLNGKPINQLETSP